MPPKLTTHDIVRHANSIRREYAQQGLKLTLRQMYYQFVSRGLAANGQKVYDRIGAVLTKARYDGRFPVDGLEDRGRTVHRGDFLTHKSDVDKALSEAGAYVRAIPDWVIEAARWYGQPTHVSVWVEKEALAGIFETVCNELGVSWFACRGYPSVSALAEWIAQVDRTIEQGKAVEAVVLYFGDHDPDGWQIPRSARDSIHALRDLAFHDMSPFPEGSIEEADFVNGKWEIEAYPVTFKRVALNMDQIRTYNPPPFPAKPTSSRFRKYLEEHNTDDAWELDALEPSVLRQLIRDEVGLLWNQEIFDNNQDEIEAAKSDLRSRMADPEWFGKVFR